MKILVAIITTLLYSPEVNGFMPSHFPTLGRQNSGLNSHEILSDTDIMCIMNAADLCSFYDNCDIEEREAILNRFEEQNDILMGRIAMMTNLIKHLKTGDHKHLEEDETNALKQKIANLVHDAEVELQP